MQIKEKNLKTKKLVTSAAFSALGVVLLFLGSVVDVLDLSMSVAASGLCMLAVSLIGGIYPMMIYLVMGTLAIILLPYKMPALIYIVFVGYYPIIKSKCEKLGVVFSFIIKLLIFNLAFCFSIFAFQYLILTPETLFAPSFLVFFVGNITFLLYDFALSAFIKLYSVRLKKLFKL
jgi:hypothetical protein